MADADTRSLQQIKSETEQTRAGLTSTVEQLKTTVAETVSDIRHRISPDAIKAEVSNYIRSRGEQLMNDVTSAARRNPMQAVAVGASIAYPVLKIARAIPLPILMVGAGLFFAGSKTGQAATQKASDMAADLSEEMVRRAHDLRDQMQDNAASVTNYASDQYERISSAVVGGSSQVKEAANVAGATITSRSGKIKDSAVSAGPAMSDRANSLKDEACASLDRQLRLFKTLHLAPWRPLGASRVRSQIPERMRRGALELRRRMCRTAPERPFCKRSNRTRCWSRGLGCWSAV